MPSLTTDDGRTLSWREIGSGPPLLCHPGGPGCSSLYYGALPELAAERTLVLLDPRGTGEPDRPRDPSAYELENYAADVEAVRDALGLERVDLLGHSHAALPNPTVVIVAGVDHFAFPEPAGRAPWSRALLDFLAG